MHNCGGSKRLFWDGRLAHVLIGSISGDHCGNDRRIKFLFFVWFWVCGTIFFGVRSVGFRICLGMENREVIDTHLSSAAAFVEGGVQEPCEDACSICLEPFSDNDPATVTSCKHEYHLQCILEWSQRSKECPMCWQLLSLKDSASQELLAAVEQERNFRLSRSPNSPMFSPNSLDEIEFHHVPAYTDDSDFEERLMQHLAAAAMGRGHFSRRENLRHRSSGQGQPQFLVFSTHSNPSSVAPNNAEPEPQSGNSPSFTAVDSSTPVMTPTREEQLQHGPSSSPPGPMSSRTGRNANVGFRGYDSRAETFPPRNTHGQLSPENQQRSRPEIQSFSESFKSRFSAVSSRYKESISRSTRGFREKLFARNSPVAELGREVQREVSAGIAGVARMMERLDPIGKNNGTAATASSNMEGSSAGVPTRHDVEEHQGSAFSDSVIGSSSCGTSSGLSTANPQTVSDKSDNCMGGTSVKDAEDSSGSEAGVQHTTATVSSPV